jgi:hypothetical protein
MPLIQKHCEENDIFNFDCVHFSDEGTFYVSGKVSIQNMETCHTMVFSFNGRASSGSG